MERTDYLANAKKLLAQWALTTALAIVPLLTAVSAHAAGVAYPILPTGNLDLVCVPTCTGNVGDSSSQSPVNGIYGVSFFTTNGGIDFADAGPAPNIEISAG
jgi:hypothetical protein